MTRVDDVARSLNTVGLAAWFGGSLMGAAALRGTSRQAIDAEHQVWKRWSTVQTAAVGAHLLGSTKLATTNKGRLLAQRGVGKVSLVKTLCTAGALGATLYASRLGSEVHRELHEGDAGGDEVPEQVRAKLGRLRMVQLAVPALTGAMLVADSRLGEQQRPIEVLRGVASRAVPDALQSLPDALQSLPDALHGLPDALQSLPGARGVGAAVGELNLPDALKHLPEAARHLPEAARHLPEAARHLPEAARHLPEAARHLTSR
jgi:hypothetical protein